MKFLTTTGLGSEIVEVSYDIDDDVVTGLETLIGRGATEDDIKVILSGYVEDNFTRRLLPAARHLRRQRQEAGQ